MGTPLAAATEDLSTALTGWEPNNVGDLRDLFKEIPGIVDALRDKIAEIGGKLTDGTPLHPDVITHMEEMIPVLSGLHEHAEQLGPLFEARHEQELERIDNPRTNEEMFDVGRQD